ncbi:MAG: T9SS type A sorting domain-containing protein [Aliifodinibius sp.]|nr:T9SS type A sorting domain-containing protein [Fodinibius sp.]NIV11620.1 T9SS type A sorting domain-containing protein [Fodinibius sp.]NIY25231.1 T9SS type A sorting domain-containing protein [Fodinibius sp.]
MNDQLPQSFALHQNYPNPFNPTTTIRFEITKSSETELNVYNALGQHVATLVNERLNTGVYDYQWDASTLASGVYFYELKTPEFTEVKKMVLMK